MPFSQKVKEKVFVTSSRHCALCKKFCGTKIEVHHITQEADGGTNDFNNAIPLCFDCHADVESYNSHHPKGNKYSKSELVRQRDALYEMAKTGNLIKRASDNDSVDMIIYNKLTELLPIHGDIEFISHYNFAGFSFPRYRTNQIFRFFEYCRSTPTFVFINPELEKLRKKLFGYSDELTTVLAYETFPVGAEFNTVPPEWEFKQPKRFEEVVNKIHSAAQNMWNTYCELLKLAVATIGAPPPL